LAAIIKDVFEPRCDAQLAGGLSLSGNFLHFRAESAAQNDTSMIKRDRLEYDFMRSQSVPARVLVADDDDRERQDLIDIVAALGYEPVIAKDGEEALEKLGSSPSDAIITDLMMPRMDGFTLLKTLLGRGDLTPAIVLTGWGSIREALTIVRDLRAFWFLEKPAQQAVLAPLLERAIAQKRLMMEAERLQHQVSREGSLGGMVGVSEPMQRVFSNIQQVAPTSTSVLITGESGTGKEYVAAAIHKLSPRASAPFVAINCAAVPETIIESELFGHEKGAFTGAIRRQPGCFEQAHRGTLLLDEIAEMALPMQAKLLRVLEESRVRRLGGKEEVPVDVRVLAATNRPVEEAVKNKTLREDLYFRLNVFNIILPPLRHRKEDIGPIAEAMIRNLNKRNDCRVTDLHPEVLGRFMSYSWPGNVRELRNVLERAVIVAREGTVKLHHLPPGFHVLQEMPMPKISVPVADNDFMCVPPGKQLPEVEEEYIRFTLRHANNNRARTAEILGISLRTLYKRLAEMAKTERRITAAAPAGIPK
jgi:DNA-binding NtrC family response regulator